MAVDAREMAKARRRLEQSLEKPTITNALSVLDKAVGGLIDLAKGRNVIDGAQGDLLHSPFGSDVAGGATNVFGKAGGMPEGADEASMMATQKNKRDKQKTSKYGSTKDPYGPGNLAGLSKSERLRRMRKAQEELDDYGDEDGEDGEEEDPRNRRGDHANKDKHAGWQRGYAFKGGDGEDGEDDEDGEDGEDYGAYDNSSNRDHDQHGRKNEKSWWQASYGDDEEEEDERAFGRTMDFQEAYGDDDDRDDDDRDDDDDDRDDDDDDDDSMKQRMARLRAMRNKKRPSRNDDDDDDEGEDEGEGEDDDDEEDHASSYGMNEGTMNNAYKSMRRRRYTVNDIHKSLVSGPRGARVAEVVEASKELAHMVNVFGHILSDISGQVDQIRRDQFGTAAVLTDAVNTVVKSQTAIAVGLERMAKSTAVLAKSNKSENTMSKSLRKSFGDTNPGVVMNGKVLAEGRDLRRSNALVDETGYAVASGSVESRLTKSLVGGVIQQAVVDGEFTAKDALRWLTETDSPASGPVAVFRQLPAKLQERIVRKTNEE